VTKVESFEDMGPLASRGGAAAYHVEPSPSAHDAWHRLPGTHVADGRRMPCRVSLFVLVLASGCGGPPAPGPDAGQLDASIGDAPIVLTDPPPRSDVPDTALAPDAPPDPAFEALVDDVIATACSETTVCELDAAAPSPPSYDCAALFGDVIRGLDPAHVTIDPSRLEACTAALAASPCTTYGVLADGCAGAITGLRSIGETCNGSLECTVGSSCAGPSGECPRCIADVGDGQDCTLADCEDGTTCVSTGGSGGDSTRCAATAGLGEDCFGHACEEGLFCEGSTTGFRCAAVTVSAMGEPCGASSGRRCAAGVVCNADGNGICGRAPLAPGDACSSGYLGSDFCPRGTYCDGTPGHCAPDLALGAPCEIVTSCGEGALCTGTCTRWAHLGSSCSVDDDCASRSCEGGRCAPVRCE
jgi:hypothetical protein